MCRLVLLTVIIMVVSASLVVSSTVIDDILVQKAMQKKTETIDIVVPVPVRCANTLPDAVGVPIAFVANNAVKPDGWQLTGYSSVKLDRDNNVSRWKIGIVNTELESWRYEQARWFDLERWQDRVNKSERSVVFGIHFFKEF